MRQDIDRARQLGHAWHGTRGPSMLAVHEGPRRSCGGLIPMTNHGGITKVAVNRRSLSGHAQPTCASSTMATIDRAAMRR